MTKEPKNARTFSEWWNKQYAWEHYVIGVLVGFLLAALIGLPFGALLATKRPDGSAEAATRSTAPAGQLQ